jgi:hypothetical protein
MKADMVISGIGVQQILPRTGTGWQGTNQSPDENNDSDRSHATIRKPDRGAPTPGTGHVVDKIA